jgi:hypothetical protein
MDGSICDQNLQLVLTILGESASAAEPRVHTTLPKVDKVEISSAEALTVPALVARPESKVMDDTLFDDNLNLLNFVMVVSLIACWMSYQLQRYWPDLEKLDGLAFVLLDTSLDFHVLSH